MTDWLIGSSNLYLRTFIFTCFYKRKGNTLAHCGQKWYNMLIFRKVTFYEINPLLRIALVVKKKSTRNNQHTNFSNQYVIFHSNQDSLFSNELHSLMTCWSIFTLVSIFLHYPQCRSSTADNGAVGFSPHFVST